MDSALRERLAARGALFGEVAGLPVARGFGDAAAEYRAVREGAGVAHRGDLRTLRLWGRDPVRMLNGLLTNDLASAAPGQGVYGTMLTAKGRVVAELRAFRRATADPAEVLAVLPNEALEPATAHLRKFVPPMFARWEDASAALGVLGVYGPRAAEQLQRVLGTALAEPGEDRFVEAPFGDHGVLVARTLEAGLEDGYDIVAPAESLAPLWDALLEREGVRPVGFGALQTLRVEAGRPRYGAELTEETIPTEAFESTGLLSRAISFTKGCYTGQEVIIRIAHRGHVNRHLRGLLLGDSPAPTSRTPLFHPDTGREVGWTASAAHSPLLRQTVALAYVRREVEPGGTVRFGSADGPPVTVAALPFTAAAAG
jgi:folate-binding protein YgfZ